MKHVVVSPMDWQLSTDLADAVREEVDAWVAETKIARIWAREAALWTGRDEARWLGWLDAIAQQQEAMATHLQLASAVRHEHVTDVLLLGMGGSSLGPEVIGQVIGSAQGFPRLHVLDSTDPRQVHSVDARLDLSRTLVIVSSKSGTTLEPNIFLQYFFDRLQAEVGRARAGRQCIAITDPGSHLEQVAARDRFRATLFGVPSIGGRYSVLSPFGTVPAALIGVDLGAFLLRAGAMAAACRIDQASNPGLRLGVSLGVAARRGRDKLTLVASPAIRPLGAWLEQLIAESTGKNGQAIIPVDGERLVSPEAYGDDRLFVYLRFRPAPDAEEDARIDALIAAGQPVVRIDVREPYDLAQEFFRWEMATAVAGAVMGINPFDQPDVEASKIKTRALTDALEATGELPTEEALSAGEGLTLFTDAANATALTAGTTASVSELLRAHLGRLRSGDYVALLAYLEMSDTTMRALQEIRHVVRDRARVATCLGFGPRFLHSTGQAYKGGPNSGLFLQITCDEAADLPVPGRRYTFGGVKAAQARGDFEVLTERGRRALRVHLGSDVAHGLRTLRTLVEEALPTA